MSENKKLTPKIRFKGFTEDWEQRKLDKYLEQYTEVTKTNNQYPALTSSRKGIFFQTEYFAGNQIASENNIGYNIVPRNYFTYRHMSDDEIFHFNINDICDFGIVSTLYPVFTTKNNMDSKYLQYQLNYGKEFYNYSILQKQGGSRTYMYFAKLKELYLTIPSYKEQCKISSILAEIDNLITLHQRKYDKLVKIKSSLLEKMFPKNSSKIPEVRFKGFTEDWEQRKVAEIGDNFSTGTLGYADLCDDGKYKCVLYGDLYTKFNERILNVKSRTNKEGTKVEINDLLFPTSTTVDSISLIAPSCVNQENIRVGGDLFGIRPYRNIDGNFVSYCINNFMPVKYSFAKQAQGLTIVHLQYNAIKNEELMIPTLDEQKKMSQLFVNIDNLITLHQRKLDKLQNIKKSLLDKMFV